MVIPVREFIARRHVLVTAFVLLLLTGVLVTYEPSLGCPLALVHVPKSFCMSERRERSPLAQG